MAGEKLAWDFMVTLTQSAIRQTLAVSGGCQISSDSLGKLMWMWQLQHILDVKTVWQFESHSWSYVRQSCSPPFLCWGKQICWPWSLSHCCTWGAGTDSGHRTEKRHRTKQTCLKHSYKSNYNLPNKVRLWPKKSLKSIFLALPILRSLCWLHVPFTMKMMRRNMPTKNEN